MSGVRGSRERHHGDLTGRLYQEAYLAALEKKQREERLVQAKKYQDYLAEEEQLSQVIDYRNGPVNE